MKKVKKISPTNLTEISYCYVYFEYFLKESRKQRIYCPTKMYLLNRIFFLHVYRKGEKQKSAKKKITKENRKKINPIQTCVVLHKKMRNQKKLLLY